MNIRQANGIGRVHVAMPGMRQTYCGRSINDEDWLTTSKVANCTGCARAGAPLERTLSALGADSVSARLLRRLVSTARLRQGLSARFGFGLAFGFLGYWREPRTVC